MDLAILAALLIIMDPENNVSTFGFLCRLFYIHCSRCSSSTTTIILDLAYLHSRNFILYNYVCCSSLLLSLFLSKEGLAKDTLSLSSDSFRVYPNDGNGPVTQSLTS
jgi:hypothetical protein